MTLIEQIKSFFPNINQSPRLLDALLAVVQKTNITKGTVLLKEGDYIQFIPLVLQGLIKVYKEVEQGNELLLYYIAPGETCIMSVLTYAKNESSTVKAVVEENSEVLLIPAQEAQEIGEKFPNWNQFMYALFSMKYEGLLYTIEVLTFSRKDRLLREYLQRESRLKRTKTIRKTHQEIALELGASREGISRLLKKMEQDQEVVLGQGAIKVLY